MLLTNQSVGQSVSQSINQPTLVDRLIELGKSFDYMVYPNRNHGLREGAGSLVHVRKLIIRYLLEHLPPGEK